MGLSLLALSWGFAEATLFFLVPDILVSWLALRGVRPALLGALAAVPGAVAGATLMYFWGAHNPMGIDQVLEHVPAVQGWLIVDAAISLKQSGLFALFHGAFTGVPSKIFAAQAHSAAIGLLPFLLVSTAAYFLRWVIVCFVVRALVAFISPGIPTKSRNTLFAAAWAAFYGLYFAVMGI